MVSWIVIFIFLPTEFFFIAFYKSGFNLCVSFEVISIMYKKARKKRERERTKKLGRLKKIEKKRNLTMLGKLLEELLVLKMHNI